MKRLRMRRRADASGEDTDGWILFKRCLFCAVGLFSGLSPLYWILARDYEWSSGMTIACVIGAAFFALGLFGSRKWISKADF
jgi:hypothetical protein